MKEKLIDVPKNILVKLLSENIRIKPVFYQYTK